MKGSKNDKGKPPVLLVPRAMVYGAARAYAFGAKKYARHNYRKGIEVSRLLEAAARHIMERAEGVLHDEESGLDPLDHAAASLGMAMDTLERIRAGKLPKELDDLWKEPRPSPPAKTAGRSARRARRRHHRARRDSPLA